MRVRALRGSLPLSQERKRGGWPACFDELWRAVEAKVGASEAARQLIDVLLLCREHGSERVELAVRGALAAGAYDGRAVAVLARRAGREVPQPLSGLEPRLTMTAHPLPTLADYDQLLEQRRR